MEAVYFTVVAILLYFVADFILDRAERMAGRRFDNRSLIFFGILMTLALVSFSLIRTYTG
ncbi:MAG: hypothetical protein JSV45_02105 [Chromatiales bacterium]|nr:MAG: hypothetical protein JSV45_02105 [Chromatiales bacterium]